MYNAILIPYELSFGEIIPYPILKEFIDSTIDFMFLVDMILQFLTTVQDKKGYEVIHPYSLAKRYVKTTRFVFDFLSLFGNSLFQMIHPSFLYFKLFKIIRIFRITAMIRN